MSTKIAQILRPFNKGFSAFQIKLVIDNLTYRYVRNIKNRIHVRFLKENNDYFIHAKVPSESDEEYPGSASIHYDVIFQLSPPNKASLEANTIREYDLKVFSNIPSFIFTFNYIFHLKRSLINLPQSYYSQRALTEKARIRNPLNLLGIDKSLWFTVYYLDENHAFRRDYIDSVVEPGLTLLQLLKDEHIASQDKKLRECESRENLKRSQRGALKKKRARERRIDEKNPRTNVKGEEVLSLFNDLSSDLRTKTLVTEALKSDKILDTKRSLNSSLQGKKFNSSLSR
jgi:hypothetical protein